MSGGNLPFKIPPQFHLTYLSRFNDENGVGEIALKVLMSVPKFIEWIFSPVSPCRKIHVCHVKRDNVLPESSVEHRSFIMAGCL